MDGDPAPAAGQHPRQGVVLGHQQATGRSPHEDLHPRGSGNALQLGQVGGIVSRGADVEGVIAVHAVAGALELVEHAVRRIGVGRGIGHLEHGSDAAHHRGAAAGFKVFLVFQPRLAEVDLAVDHAGQHVEPGAVDPARGIGIGTDADDAPIAHGNIGNNRAGRRVNSAIGKDELGSGLGHDPAHATGLSRREPGHSPWGCGAAKAA